MKATIGIIGIAVMGLILTIVVFVALCWCLFAPAEAIQCKTISAQNPNYEFAWHPWLGCLFYADGIWIDANNFHYVLGDFAD